MIVGHGMRPRRLEPERFAGVRTARRDGASADASGSVVVEIVVMMIAVVIEVVIERPIDVIGVIGV